MAPWRDGRRFVANSTETSIFKYGDSQRENNVVVYHWSVPPDKSINSTSGADSEQHRRWTGVTADFRHHQQQQWIQQLATSSASFAGTSIHSAAVVLSIAGLTELKPLQTLFNIQLFV